MDIYLIKRCIRIDLVAIRATCAMALCKLAAGFGAFAAQYPGVNRDANYSLAKRISVAFFRVHFVAANGVVSAS